jgi:hypothetical protein
MSGNSISQGCTGVYIPGGSYAVTVTNENGTSNIVPFTVTTSIVDNTPTITNISPSSGAFGAALTIVGTHFTSSDNQIVFKGLSTGSTYYVNSPQTSTDGTTLNAKVTSCPPPVIIANAMAQSCSGVVIPAGQYTVTVVNSNGTSNAVSFTITAGTTTTTAAPTITSVTPSSGAQGGSFTITGSNFTSTGNTITLLAISAGSSGMTATAYSVNSPQTSADGNTIQFTLTSCPPTAPLCPGVAIREGTYSLSVSNANGSSNTVTFTVAQTM